MSDLLTTLGQETNLLALAVRSGDANASKVVYKNIQQLLKEVYERPDPKATLAAERMLNNADINGVLKASKTYEEIDNQQQRIDRALTEINFQIKKSHLYHDMSRRTHQVPRSIKDRLPFDTVRYALETARIEIRDEIVARSAHHNQEKMQHDAVRHAGLAASERKYLELQSDVLDREEEAEIRQQQKEKALGTFDARIRGEMRQLTLLAEPPSRKIINR